MPYVKGKVIYDEHTHVAGIIDAETEAERYGGDLAALYAKMLNGVFADGKPEMHITEFDRETGKSEMRVLYADLEKRHI